MKKIIFIFTLLIISLSARAEGSILIIANKAHQGNVEVARLQDLFLGRSREVSQGWRAEPIDQASSSEIRNKFYRSLLGKNPAAMQSHWAELVFSGRARAPRSQDSEEAVIQYVSINQDAVGYVSEHAKLDNKVVVIARVPIVTDLQ